MTKKKQSLIAILSLIVAITLFGGIWYALTPKSVSGSKEITITINHADETVNEFTLYTDAEYLRAALEEESLIAGVESDYGLYVLTVDGETADETNQEWWCVTKSGEMLMTGVDTTPITDGDTYELTLTIGY